MSRNRRYHSYRGRSYQRPRSAEPNRILRATVAVLFVVTLILALVFFLLQDYVVYSDSGIRLELPWLTDKENTPAPSPSPSVSSPIINEDKQTAASVTRSPSPSPSAPAEVPIHAVQISADDLLAGKADQLVEQAGGNAALITMKEDSGNLNYVSSIPMARSSGATHTDNRLNEALASLEMAGVYTVAQLSCFRDHLLPTVDANLSIRTNSGYCWEDHEDVRWSSPANGDVRQYLTDLCAELAQLGFDEILLTNCGYPTSDVGNLSWIREDSSYPEGRLDTVLTPFLEQVSTALKPYETKLSVRAPGSELTGETQETGLTMESVLSSCRRIWVEEGKADACLAAAGEDFDPARRLVSFRTAPGENAVSWAVPAP